MASYPGDYAVPGLMWPGFALPGEPVPGSPGGEWLFTGQYPVTYPQYIDASTQLTLSASPGGAYCITPVGGDPGVTNPPGDGRWIAALA